MNAIFWQIRMKMIIFMVFFLICSVSHAKQSSVQILLPMPAPSHFTKDQFAPWAESERFVTRIGAVILDINTILSETPVKTKRVSLAASFKGEVLELVFFADKLYKIVVTKESSPRQNVVILDGRLVDHALATFSLTITSESYIMTLNDPKTSTLYRVVGETETGIGRVTEMDRKNMPPILYSPPLIPPTD